MTRYQTWKANKAKIKLARLEAEHNQLITTLQALTSTSHYHIDKVMELAGDIAATSKLIEILEGS